MGPTERSRRRTPSRPATSWSRWCRWPAAPILEVGLHLKKRIHKGGAEVHGDRTGQDARPFRRRRRQPRAFAAVLGHAHRARRRHSTTSRPSSTSAPPSWGSGAQARPRRGRRLLRGTGGTRGGRAAVLDGPHPRRGNARCVRRVRLLPGGLRGGTGGGAAPRGGLRRRPRHAGLLALDGGSGGPIGTERLLDFPRQRRDRHLCLADFVRSRESGQVDVLPVQLVTAGSKIDEVTSKLFAGDHYRDYYELNGWSCSSPRRSRILARTHPLELGFAAEEPKDKAGLFKLDYRGAVLARLPRVPGHGGPPQGTRTAEARANGRDPER